MYLSIAFNQSLFLFFMTFKMTYVNIYALTSDHFISLFNGGINLIVSSCDHQSMNE